MQFWTVGRQEVQLNPLVPQLRPGLLHFLRAVAGGMVQHHHPGLALPRGQSIEQKIAHICTFPGARRRPPGQGRRGGGAGSAPGIGGGQRGRESAFVQVQELELAGAGFFVNACNSARATATRSGSCVGRRQDWVRW